MNHIISIVGMTGSGKTEASKILEKLGYHRIHFGDITMEIMKQKRLAINEKNEREVRESIRQEHGMAAYAIRNIPKIEKALRSTSVVIDGLYSWSEYLALKEKFGAQHIVLAITTDRRIRYQRLTSRTDRPLTQMQAESRDIAEIQNIEKAGPIAIADDTILNNGTLEDLKKSIEKWSSHI